MAQFFISCPVGFEAELWQEVSNFWPLMIDLDGLPTREALPDPEKHHGGVEVSVPLHIGYQINFFSRIALRVLLRVGSFKARYFDQLEGSFKKLELHKVVSKTENISLKVESAKSRLFHKKNIEEAVGEILKKEGFKVSEEGLGVYIRIFNDVVTVSVDTTGEHLHFRGYRKHQGAAPLRENLAAILVQELGLNINSSHMVLDPFCGSGTLLFESLLPRFGIFNRPYNFFKLVNLPALFKSASWTKNYRYNEPPRYIFAVGFEKDKTTYNKFLKNQEEFEKDFFAFTGKVYNVDSDSVDLDKILTDLNQSGFYVLANPPYGERIEDNQSQLILEKIAHHPKCKKMIVLHPESWKWFQSSNESKTIANKSVIKEGAVRSLDSLSPQSKVHHSSSDPAPVVKQRPFSNQGLKVIMTVIEFKQ